MPLRAGCRATHRQGLPVTRCSSRSTWPSAVCVTALAPSKTSFACVHKGCMGWKAGMRHPFKHVPQSSGVNGSDFQEMKASQGTAQHAALSTIRFCSCFSQVQ